MMGLSRNMHKNKTKSQKPLSFTQKNYTQSSLNSSLLLFIASFPLLKFPMMSHCPALGGCVPSCLIRHSDCKEQHARERRSQFSPSLTGMAHTCSICLGQCRSFTASRETGVRAGSWGFQLWSQTTRLRPQYYAGYLHMAHFRGVQEAKALHRH